MHVHPGGRVEVVAPLRVRAAEVQAFVAESQDWIDRARGQLKHEPPLDTRLPDRIDLAATGMSVNVSYSNDLGRRRYLHEPGGDLKLAAPRAHGLKCRSVLRSWLAQSARESLVPWLRELSQELGIDYARTQVRGQKTRWGSCSSTGVISINFCLLFLQPELVRYLFIHELCHRRQFSHCRRYWALVGSIEPEYKALDRSLSEAWRDVPGWVRR